MNFFFTSPLSSFRCLIFLIPAQVLPVLHLFLCLSLASIFLCPIQTTTFLLCCSQAQFCSCLGGSQLSFCMLWQQFLTGTHLWVWSCWATAEHNLLTQQDYCFTSQNEISLAPAAPNFPGHLIPAPLCPQPHHIILSALWVSSAANPSLRRAPLTFGWPGLGWLACPCFHFCVY